MQKIPTILAVALVCVLSTMSTPALYASEDPSVSGVLGMAPVTEASCAGVWVPVGKSQALAGVTWYNNDGLAVFPEVLVAGGTEDEAVSLADCSVAAEGVSGSSSSWCSVLFDAPIISRRGGIYVLFRFPAGSEHIADGSGGGAGIGYVEGGGLTGWLTADGADWVRIDDPHGFAVIPEYVKAESWMVEKSGRMYEPEENEQLPEPEVFETALLPAVPNPFNPSTEISFTLKSASRVGVAVYDIRGHKVAGLIGGRYEAGAHAVTWEGLDNRGQRVSSGVYFIRMTSGEQEFSQRVMLLK